MAGDLCAGVAGMKLEPLKHLALDGFKTPTPVFRVTIYDHQKL